MYELAHREERSDMLASGRDVAVAHNIAAIVTCTRHV